MGNKKRKGRYYVAKKKKYYGKKPETAPDSNPVPVEAEPEDIGRSSSFAKLVGCKPWWEQETSDSDGEVGIESDTSLTSNPDTSDSSDDSDCLEADEPHTGAGNRIFDLEQLQEILLKCAVCAVCKVGSIILEEERQQGLGSHMVISCSSESCPGANVKFSSSIKTRFFDVNRRSVLAARRIGRGHSGLQKFCAIMDLPKPVNKTNFQKHQQAAIEAAHTVGEKSRNYAAQQLLAENPEGQIAVTFDGTWQRRGYSSLNGVFTAISWSSGKVVDIHTSAKYCHQCSVWTAKEESGTISTATLQEWQVKHADSCSANTKRSSPGMESEAARLLWCRSVEKRGLMYTTYVGDGDCKGHKEVCEARPYGDVAVTKEECVGHVQKRLGKALRDLKKSMKGQKLSDGLTIGGAGRLTDKVIDTLQTYYGLAVRANTDDAVKMAQAIWAGLFHRYSTDDKPRHFLCPGGADSWCGFKRVQAGAQPTYIHHNILPEAIYKLLVPVYRRLADQALLKRCLLGATQNANEAFNGVVWRMCPKEVNAGRGVVELAANLATCTFNDGAMSLCQVLEEMSCSVGHNTIKALKKEDTDRIAHAEVASSALQKSTRKKRRRKKKGWEEQRTEQEGITYEPGGF